MHVKRLSKVLLLGCAVALGGCQSAGKHPLSSAGQHQDQRLAAAAASAPETDLGRAHLAAQRNGLAIEAFNRALVFGEAPAPALNGLGVAYARMGRVDLAYRFFSQAASTDPDSAIYARNLATLTNSPAFTLAATRPVAAKRLAQPKTAAAPREPGKLYREGNRQVTLITRPAKDMAANCAVSFKGAKQANCSAPARPQVAARNKAVTAAPAAAPEPMTATEPAKRGARKVVAIVPERSLPKVVTAKPDRSLQRP